MVDGKLKTYRLHIWKKLRIKCIEYGILFVDTVDMKIKASNAFNAMFVDTVDTGVCGSYTTPYAGVKTLYKVTSCPCQEGKLLYCVASHLGGLAVHQSVRGGSFVNFLGLVKLQGWLQATRTANPQFLKLKGAQQPGNSYKSMTKLHPPYPNWTCHK